MPPKYVMPLIIAALFLMGLYPAPAQNLPADVTAFIEKRGTCDHFRGEEAYDAARAAYINKQLHLNCKDTDKTLSVLRKKYAANPIVLRELAGYETTIEAQ